MFKTRCKFCGKKANHTIRKGTIGICRICEECVNKLSEVFKE